MIGGNALQINKLIFWKTIKETEETIRIFKEIHV